MPTRDVLYHYFQQNLEEIANTLQIVTTFNICLEVSNQILLPSLLFWFDVTWVLMLWISLGVWPFNISAVKFVCIYLSVRFEYCFFIYLSAGYVPIFVVVVVLNFQLIWWLFIMCVCALLPKTNKGVQYQYWCVWNLIYVFPLDSTYDIIAHIVLLNFT